MHPTTLPKGIHDRLIARRGRLHVHDHLDPARCALLVVDMQDGFVAPGGLLEVPMARAIVPNIVRLAEATRRTGGRVVWITCDFNGALPEARWPGYFDCLLSPELAAAVRASLTPGGAGHALWRDLVPEEGDLHFVKTRFSAFMPDPAPLNALLRPLGIDTLLITGTVTNVCCEATARDAMMQDYKVVFLSDGNAAQTDEEHLATLANVAQIIGDARTTEEVIALLEAGAASAASPSARMEPAPLPG